LLLVVVDTLRADHLGVYGYERATSPQLDAWAVQAAVFEDVRATSAWTLPSFGSLFTGQIPSRHAAGLLMSEAGEERRFASLDAGTATLAELLAAQGFATAGVGNNPFLHSDFGLSRGFETWDYVFGNYARHPRASQLVYWALRWLDAQADSGDERPFFMMLHLFDPHLPYDAGAGARGSFTSGYDGSLQLPFVGFGEANAHWVPRREVERRFVRDAYDEEILFVDQQLARLFAGLRERGLESETLVVVTADHGEEFFEHAGFEHGHTLYDELLRIPLLMRGPGVEPARIDAALSLVDVMPTLLEALGMEVPADIAGRSFWPLVSGEGSLARPLQSAGGTLHGQLAEGTLHGPDRKALISDGWKLVTTAGEAPRLYHLAEDPGERQDLAGQQPERLTRLLDELRRTTRSAARERVELLPVELDESTRRQLEGLGYLE